MDYKKHYDLLCERAKSRKLDCYTESHHVIPRCMGGTDDPDNLVDLTPEEHYVAHQLLVKMYPKHKGLVFAAIQMSGNAKSNSRDNKLYGWLKRLQSKVAKQRKGSLNGSYGKYWYYHPDTLENIKCLPDEVPEGFVKGRKLKQNKCNVCGAKIEGRSKFCYDHDPRFETARQIDSNLELLIDEFSKTRSITQALSLIGLTNRRGNAYFSSILKRKGFDVLKRRNSPR